MSITVSGQTAIITGAGRGIGRAHAFELARRGANVVVNDIDRDVTDDTVAAIRDAGGNVIAAVGSVTDTGDLDSLVDAAVGEFGSIEILINNAGVLRTGYFDELTDAQIDVVLDTHLRAAFDLTRRVWPHMRQQHYGRIIMTSSPSGMFSHQGLSNYAAAKAGLYGLTKALAFEGAEHGIHVNAILPMAITPSPAKDSIPGLDDELLAQVPDLPRTRPERRDPALVANMVAYLVSSECQLSGEAFSIAFGRFARVFVGVADGWLSPTPVVSVDDIAAHIDEIRDISHHTVPMWLFDEVRDAVARVLPLDS